MGDSRWQKLAELAVHAANVQPGQSVMVNAEYNQAEAARACAAAAYDRGARFVDVVYFDLRVKRERVLHADPDTLTFVPRWWGDRLLSLAEERGARVTLAGLSTPNLFGDVDPALAGRDAMPRIKEVSKVVGERLTNWTIVPCAHVEWAKVVHPDLPEDEALERLWGELEHVLRLDEPSPTRAWDERMAVLDESGRRLTERRFDAIELRGPGTELRIGLLPTGSFVSASFERDGGVRHIANVPTEEIFTSPDPERTEGHVTATKPLVLQDGTVVSGLRVRFENGRAVEIDADENAEALRAKLAVDDGGRIGPLGTVFFDTLLDENAASHIALGGGFPFTVGEADRDRVNDSAAHVDFMIGSPEVEVDGVTADGERVPVLRGGAWQI